MSTSSERAPACPTHMGRLKALAIGARDQANGRRASRPRIKGRQKRRDAPDMSAFLTTALRSDMVSCSYGKQLHPSAATPRTAPHPPQGTSPLSDRAPGTRCLNTLNVLDCAVGNRWQPTTGRDPNVEIGQLRRSPARRALTCRARCRSNPSSWQVPLPSALRSPRRRPVPSASLVKLVAVPRHACPRSLPCRDLHAPDPPSPRTFRALDGLTRGSF